ncbi:sigma-70 family RNA polymerase sigma factor [Actinomadura sp. LD22]|uniref:Sigma-70 family RNA polymerase sigma factor n=1 Tax=Actinomadura physcomitrii TaxID=2650748 RepID=A0A6I4MTZ8_9ACTN|nr:RNA polymerase sigma factor [Actinomadura physcomitrii]MWA07417.1 sigma-70 family RNA polymerase sigma factor [Actinomadura physcomitrii]
MSLSPYLEVDISAEVDDVELIARSRNQPEAFSEIFDRHARRLRGYVARRLGSDAADDVVAETFLIAFQCRNKHDFSRADARSWLFGIAERLVGDHRRSEMRMRRAFARSVFEPLASEALDERVADVVTAEAQGPRLATALAGLNERDREPLLLRTLGGMSCEEIGDVLDIPVGAVRSRLHRARRTLRAALDSAHTG